MEVNFGTTDEPVWRHVHHVIKREALCQHTIKVRQAQLVKKP